MVIYSNIKSGFIHDLPTLPNILKDSIAKKLGEDSSEGEILSWQNSLRYMADVVNDKEIPDDAGIALEYNIPVTNNRIDFLISGLNADGVMQVILVELKQWQHVQPTEKDGIVVTRYADGMKETTHPSYQVACYASLLYDCKI